MNEIQQLQDELRYWSDATFGKDRHGVPMMYHLKKEVDELIAASQLLALTKEYNIEASNRRRERVRGEFADCMMLLMDAASHMDFNMNDLIQAVRDKLEVNKARVWGKPDENGVIEHIE